ncbi:major capsid protein [Chlamydia abortus]|uniref:Structural protein n=1 Tax=Chlamydia phage 2 TaxID=105154 RepID=Q9MBU6_9VIRU|nr:structural protein [Chlamydia phage 2]CAB85589.1 structural protein [Chlamydia phage 2]SFW07308.1 major capsid protein [Chlamydia abortus]
MVRNRRLPSVMSHSFAQVPSARIQRSSFDRSCGLKTTFDAGYLIPIFCDEVLPGDTFSLKEAFLARMATPIFPLMDNLRLDTQYFFVPLRLLWSNFQKFCGEQDNPDDSTDFLTPILTAPAGGFTEGSIHDYLGLPTKVAGVQCVAFWHRAYNLIWNQYYRDENIQESVEVQMGDTTTDEVNNYTLLKRGKRYDYFTSCLPWPQKGPAVTIGVGGKAPIEGLYMNVNSSNPVGKFVLDSQSTPRVLQDLQGNKLSGIAAYNQTGKHVYVNSAWYTVTPQSEPAATLENGNYYTTQKPQIYADLGATSPVTINSLREAFQLQKLYERDARGGTRYIEIIRSHFNVQSPDARLQRAEYLGGSSTPVNISPIPQTSSTDSTSPQGNLAAYGTAIGSKRVFTKSFTEHGVILGLASVRADLNYQQGLDRMWSRRTRWDFYWPALSHLGEQAVLNKEIYCQGPSVKNSGGEIVDDQVFGYQERFAEYRYKTSKITGKFRSNATSSLDSWHLAQEFENLPTLSPEFIEENPPMDRVLAVSTEPDFLLDGWFSLRCARPMPVYSVPGFIDHF